MNKRQTKKLRRKYCPRCRRDDRVKYYTLTNCKQWRNLKFMVVDCGCGWSDKNFSLGESGL